MHRYKRGTRTVTKGVHVPLQRGYTYRYRGAWYAHPYHVYTEQSRAEWAAADSAPNIFSILVKRMYRKNKVADKGVFE